jgi:hypothetical protein
MFSMGMVAHIGFQRTHPCLRIVPLDARQVTRRDGITQARELRVTAVERALETILRGAKRRVADVLSARAASRQG